MPKLCAPQAQQLRVADAQSLTRLIVTENPEDASRFLSQINASHQSR
jgi:hypothetical protein